jgi:hypothetical protein
LAARSLGWPVETIPDEDTVYRRVHKALLDLEDPDFIPPAAFRVVADEISVEWEKYASADEALRRARDPLVNGLVELQASTIRETGSLDVKHTPLSDNRAHANIVGFHGLQKSKLTKLRLQLSMRARWTIKPPVPVGT